MTNADWLAEMSKVWMDEAVTGTGFMRDGKRVAPEDVYALPEACPLCNSCQWVCESHPTKPWEDQPGSGPNACHCGGAGKPCPRCNEMSRENPKGDR